MNRLFFSIFAFTLLFMPFIVNSGEITIEELKKNVDRKKSGSCMIRKIPAVKSKRNYCVPASMEMIMRYYKVKVNQKYLGKIFNSDKSTGTYTSEMMKNFSGEKLEGFKIKQLFGMTKSESDKLFEAYLSSSKLSKSKSKKFSKILEKKGFVDAVNSMDQKIVFEVFPPVREKLNKLFPELLEKYIDNGIPLLWSVIMNFDPDNQTDGFHMRVMTGYKKDKSGNIEKIFYMDPWSSSKNTEGVDFDKAVAMTMEFFAVTPENIEISPDDQNDMDK